jgi:hypothetical protein
MSLPHGRDYEGENDPSNPLVTASVSLNTLALVRITILKIGVVEIVKRLFRSCQGS